MLLLGALTFGTQLQNARHKHYIYLIYMCVCIYLLVALMKKSSDAEGEVQKQFRRKDYP